MTWVVALCAISTIGASDMASTAWSKFFWSDWSNDPALRLCSLAAQGLWMRMLCVAAESDPRGFVMVNCSPLDSNDIARLAGETKATVDELLSELERKGVFSRDRKGCIYSRRMVRDEKTARKNQKNGELGGNPSLRKERRNSEWDNLPDKGEVKAHKPEARSHKPESSNARAPEQPPDPVSKQHRIAAADLLDRGKASLSPWERRFLEDLCAKQSITPKMQATLEGIAAKIGLDLSTVMATWRKRLETARKLNQWDSKWGPIPGNLGCLVPDELLLPGDGNGWTEWRAAS